MAQAASVTIQTNGQTLVVNLTAPGSATEAFFSDAALSSSVTLPYTATSDVTLYTGNFGPYALSVKQSDGTELRGEVVRVAPDSPVVVAPQPSLLQLAADARPSNALMRAGALAETYTRRGAVIANTGQLSSGRLQLVGIELPAGLLVSSITYLSGTQAAVTPTAQWFALFNADRTLIGQTVDDTTTAWAADSEKTLAIASPVTTTRSGFHYLGICVAAATPPSLMSVAGGAVPSALAPIMAGQSTTGLTTTAPSTAAAITAVGAQPYAWVG